jgi:MFS transporter, PHS family, inorganic phosphate transporter
MDVTILNEQIFAINMVTPMLRIDYFESDMPPNIQIGINIATLGGSILGQLIFGIAADRLGRRRMYGWELLITIVATIGVATASSGIGGIDSTPGISPTYRPDPRNGSLSIVCGLVAWRFVLGLAIGAGHPLSTVICLLRAYP